MYTRGIRGAVKLSANERAAILKGTTELIEAMLEANEIEPEDVAGILFTATSDITAEFPAFAVRKMGHLMIPMLHAVEIAKPGSMELVVRVLMYVNTKKRQNEIRHQYLGEAANLRPDINRGNGIARGENDG